MYTQPNNENEIVRYYRTAQVSETGIASQQSTLDRYCEAHGLTTAKSYIDDGFSGLNFQRPALTELLTDIALGFVKTVLVTGVDRIGRDAVQTAQLIQKLYEQAGVEFIFVKEGTTSKEVAQTADLIFLSEPLAHLLVEMAQEAEGGEDE